MVKANNLALGERRGTAPSFHRFRQALEQRKRERQICLNEEIHAIDLDEFFGDVEAVSKAQTRNVPPPDLTIGGSLPPTTPLRTKDAFRVANIAHTERDVCRHNAEQIREMDAMERRYKRDAVVSARLVARAPAQSPGPSPTARSATAGETEHSRPPTALSYISSAADGKNASLFGASERASDIASDESGCEPDEFRWGRRISIPVCNHTSASPELLALRQDLLHENQTFVKHTHMVAKQSRAEAALVKQFNGKFAQWQHASSKNDTQRTLQSKGAAAKVDIQRRSEQTRADRVKNDLRRDAREAAQSFAHMAFVIDSACKDVDQKELDACAHVQAHGKINTSKMAERARINHLRSRNDLVEAQRRRKAKLDRDLTDYRLKKMAEDEDADLKNRRSAVLAQRSVAAIVKVMTAEAVNKKEEDVAAEGFAAYEAMLGKLQVLAADMKRFVPEKDNEGSMVNVSTAQALELVEPKVRHAFSAGSASTACPASAGQDAFQWDASPLGVPSAESTHSTWPRASTATSGAANADLDAREDPEDPPPLTARPIIGVPQQAKQSIDRPNTFRVRRELGSLAAMRQIRRTGPVIP